MTDRWTAYHDLAETDPELAAELAHDDELEHWLEANAPETETELVGFGPCELEEIDTDRRADLLGWL